MSKSKKQKKVLPLKKSQKKISKKKKVASREGLPAKTVKVLVCPKCKETWGTVAIAEDGCVLPQDIQVSKGTHKVYKNGDDLACSCCGYLYKTWDMILLVMQNPQEQTHDIAAAMAAKEEDNAPETTPGL